MEAMEHKSQLQLFEGRKVRTVWNEEVQEWFFSVVDVVAVLTDSADPKQYIKKMRARDPELNVRWGTICTPTRMMASDGIKVISDTATTLRSLDPKAMSFISAITNIPKEQFRCYALRQSSQRHWTF